MTLDEHTNLIRDIRTNLNDEGKVSELLAQISDGFSTALSERSQMEEQLNNIKTANESLRDANMKLFLRVGKSVAEDDESKEKKKDSENENKLSFEKLFNEKGELI